ncbi:hypothetical protein ACQKQD_19015 [Methylobacterium sp. NPDC080182]|uniref:hypothetical protein n=1 Tax=Methylobacterium sp. NPDC080182 TaxID=3390590 RepID=UPI003D03FED2
MSAPLTSPLGGDDLIEIVARAIFEADEDLNDAQEARLRAAGQTAAADCLAGPRARWDDPKNASILDAFRLRARAAIKAYRATEGRIVALPALMLIRDCAVCACEPEPIPNCPACGGVGGFTKAALTTSEA